MHALSFGFTYRAHVEVQGWQHYVTSPGGVAGSVGLSRRMEGTQIYGPRYADPNYVVTSMIRRLLHRPDLIFITGFTRILMDGNHG